jgi:hypothetical protein
MAGGGRTLAAVVFDDDGCDFVAEEDEDIIQLPQPLLVALLTLVSFVVTGCDKGFLVKRSCRNRSKDCNACSWIGSCRWAIWSYRSRNGPLANDNDDEAVDDDDADDGDDDDDDSQQHRPVDETIQAEAGPQRRDRAVATMATTPFIGSYNPNPCPNPHSSGGRPSSHGYVELHGTLDFSQPVWFIAAT